MIVKCFFILKLNSSGPDFYNCLYIQNFLSKDEEGQKQRFFGADYELLRDLSLICPMWRMFVQ